MTRSQRIHSHTDTLKRSANHPSTVFFFITKKTVVYHPSEIEICGPYANPTIWTESHFFCSNPTLCEPTPLFLVYIYHPTITLLVYTRYSCINFFSSQNTLYIILHQAYLGFETSPGWVQGGENLFSCIPWHEATSTFWLSSKIRYTTIEM